MDDYNETQLLRIKEMKEKQLSSVSLANKLRICDLYRIIENTNNSIFDPENCSIWNQYNAYVTNKKKGVYINFYFKDKKKIALHRLIYANFKEELTTNEYIRYSCENKGICCNVNHMFKCEYISEGEQQVEKKQYEDTENNFKVIIN